MPQGQKTRVFKASAWKEAALRMNSLKRFCSPCSKVQFMLRGTDKFLIKKCKLKMRSVLCVVTVPFQSGKKSHKLCSFSQCTEIREYTGESSCVYNVITHARKNSTKLWIHMEKIVKLLSKQLNALSPYSHMKESIQIVIIFVFKMRLAMIYLQSLLMLCNSFSVSTAGLIFTLNK